MLLNHWRTLCFGFSRCVLFRKFEAKYEDYTAAITPLFWLFSLSRASTTRMRGLSPRQLIGPKFRGGRGQQEVLPAPDSVRLCPVVSHVLLLLLLLFQRRYFSRGLLKRKLNVFRVPLTALCYISNLTRLKVI